MLTIKKYSKINVINTIKMTLVSALLLEGCYQPKIPIKESPGSPLFLAIQAMGENFQNELTNVTISQSVHGESPTSAKLEIEKKDLLDDSVAAEKTIFLFSNKNGKWVIDSRSKQQTCYKDRGHQDYSTLPCH